MRRRYVISLIVLAIVLFLVISALLARAFNVGGAEDAAITNLVRAEGRGDTKAVIALISGCASSPACRAHAARLSAKLRHPGAVATVAIQNSSSFSLGSTVGTTRVVWIAGQSLPRTQCVRVRHAGSVIAGFRIELLKVSPRIVTDADCPSRF